MATRANSPQMGGGDTGHSSKRLPRRYPPGCRSHGQQRGLCEATDAAERREHLFTAHCFLCGAAVPKCRWRRAKPTRQTSATEASGGREACSPVRGCSQAVSPRHGLGQQRRPCPGPPPSARPHGPWPSPPTLLLLPPEGASSPVTAQRGDPGLFHPLPAWGPGAQVRGLGREGAGWKAAPHPVPSPLPLEARPRGQPLQGRQAHSPSPTPSSTRGSALHTCQHEGPARGPVPPATRALPGPEEPVSTDGPDGQSPRSTGAPHVPIHPN